MLYAPCRRVFRHRIDSMTSASADSNAHCLSGSLGRGTHVGFPPASRFVMVPLGPVRATRAALALYEAVELRQRVAARSAHFLGALGLLRLLPRVDRPEIDWEWWLDFAREIALPIIASELHLVAFRVPGNPRVSALLMDRLGRPQLFAKLLNSAQPELSAAASELLMTPRLRTFCVPRTVAEGEFRGRRFRLLEPLPEGLHMPPPFQPSRLWDVVDEWRNALISLPRPASAPDHHVPCHADLTPRNLRIASDGSWWLFDWDNVRWGPPLADELRYWSAEFAYRLRPQVNRDAKRVLTLLRQRGSNDDIREAVDWPHQLRQTYRRIEPLLHAAVGGAVNEGN